MGKIIAFVQKIVAADKAVLIGAAVTAAQALVASFGFHLSGTGVALVTAIVTAGIAYFVGAHFALKAEAAAAIAAAKAGK